VVREAEAGRFAAAEALAEAHEQGVRHWREAEAAAMALHQVREPLPLHCVRHTNR
jgi:hypothetical protein